MKFPAPALSLIKRLEDNGYEAWIVGGAVRDAWLHKNIHDIDITCSARPEEIEEVFSDCKTIDVGKSFGTIRVIWKGEVYELTSFRSEEGYRDGRHPDRVYYAKTIEEDLSRRDFTINAMAFNPNRGILDIFNGRADYENGILRAVGHADERISEDGLRMLRAVRFAGRFGLELDRGLEQSIMDRKHQIKRISIERCMDEINKMLMSANPEKSLEKMKALGLMETLMPEIDTIPDKAVFEELPKELYHYWAALLSDGGKSGKAQESITKRILKRFKSSNMLIKMVGLLVKESYMTLPTDLANCRKWLIHHSLDEGKAIVDYNRALVLSFENDEEKNKALEIIEKMELCINEIANKKLAISIKDLEVSGSDLIKVGYNQGKDIGIILNQSLEDHIYGLVENNKAQLLEYITNKWGRNKEC